MDISLAFIELFFWSVYLISPLLFLLGVVVALLGAYVGHIEGWTKFNSLYWALITASTVGYGDIRPLKKRSKVLSIIIALIGIMFTGILVAVTISSATTAFELYPDEDVIERLKQKFGD